jgi:hypothetical protein
MPEWKDILAACVTLVASFSGAWAAFGLENNRRIREERLRQIGAANRAIYTLFQYWNTLEQYRKEVLEPFRNRPDAWLNLAATPVNHGSLQSFNADDLQFLLQCEHPQIFAELMLEEQRSNLALGLIRERSNLVIQQAFPRMAQAGFEVGKPRSLEEIEKALGVDVTHQLKALTTAIYKHIDEDISSLRGAHDELRNAMRRIHPKHKTVEVQFSLPENAAPLEDVKAY